MTYETKPMARVAVNYGDDDVLPVGNLLYSSEAYEAVKRERDEARELLDQLLNAATSLLAKLPEPPPPAVVDDDDLNFKVFRVEVDPYSDERGIIAGLLTKIKTAKEQTDAGE